MDSMDLDIDMDVDVDLVPDEPIGPEASFGEDTGNRSEGEVDPQEVFDADAPVPYKVHLRGLDIMKPEDIKLYAAEHFPDSQFERIEWIDDTSANLIYTAESIASQALVALAADPIEDVSQLPRKELLRAKPFSKNSEVALQVRIAVAGDKKQRGAASRSKFYLWNPEYDPEERRRRRAEYRDRDGGRSRRRRRSYDDEPVEKYEASMYDDDTDPVADRAARPSQMRRRRSYSPESDRGDGRGKDSYRNRGKELFPLGGRSRNDSRNRSLSPGRDRDGDRGMDDGSNQHSGARNRERARAVKERLSQNNQGRELFPSERGSGSGRLGDSSIDKVDNVAEKLAKGITLPLMDGSSDVPASQRSRRLEDRITASGAAAADSSAFNIRGSATQRNSQQGFAIKGGAGKSVKELFPDKFGEGGSNTGKELFADRVESRKRRQRAGDLFD